MNELEMEFTMPRHRTKVALSLFVLLGTCFGSSLALAGDDIHLRDDKVLRDTVISAATYEQVTFTPQGIKRSQEVPASTVRAIVWRPASNRSLPKGVAAYDGGRHDEAIKRLRGASKLSRGRPEEGYCRYMYGLALLAKGDVSSVDQGITVLATMTKEMKASKDFYLPWAQIALAEAFLARGKYPDAERCYTALGGYGSAFTAESDMGKGRMALVQGKHADARKIFSRLTKDASLSQDRKYEAHLGYARAQLGMGQHDGAMETVRSQVVNKAKLGSVAAQGYLVWGQAQLAVAGTNNEKLEWAAIRFMRAAILSGLDNKTRIEALKGAKQAFGKLGQKDRVQDLEQRIARLK